MSGGFFRGTSADQDTRFSNKQAKLMKSQKFAPELENLVDMTKVKMDVMRPWIANRVTELLGFEDEVLINFIYGLLDGKVVNGKEVQISLTGFMEKNTGKFMKELWMLLLSAEKNASGVPQQFLDAKEEETRKKKAETDRIASEIQKKKEREGRELEQAKIKKTDGEVDISRSNNIAMEPNSKRGLRASSVHSTDEKGTGERNGSRGRSRVSRSPHSADRPSLSPLNRRSRSISKSISKSFSNSRSYSDERRKSRNISESPHTRSRSISSERLNHSPPRRSVTPPSRRRSFHTRRRSTSRPRLRSPSPVRHRRRRSRSPIRHRSRSPVRRRSRSPVRYRSRSPMRRGSPSPIRRRSPSPVRRRSPYPVRRRSPSPVRRRYRRSPSTPRHRSPSPRLRRSPIPSRRRLPTPSRHRSPSHEQWSSPSPVRGLSPSPGRRKSPKRQRRSPVQTPKERNRVFEKLSPIRHARTRDNAERSTEIRKGPDSVVLRPPVSLRSPQRDPRDRDDTRGKPQSSSPSSYGSLSHSGSPPGSRRRSHREDRRSFSPHVSPAKQTKEQKLQDISASPPPKPRDQKLRLDNPVTRGEKAETYYAKGNGDPKLKSSEKRSAHLLTVDENKASHERVPYKNDHSFERVGGHHSNEIQSLPAGLELKKKDQGIGSAKTSKSLIHPEVSEQGKLPTIKKGTSLSERHPVSSPEDIQKYDKKDDSHSDEAKGSKLPQASLKLIEGDEEDRSGSLSSGSQERDKRRHEVREKRKHKRSERKEVASDDSDDSKVEGRKDAKRRRKEEKRLRKDERRRRREEKRRRREERRRAEKLKDKSIDNVTPSADYEKNNDSNASDSEHIVRTESGASDAEVTETEQKRLEIELRKKALESLRAKRGVGH